MERYQSPNENMTHVLHETASWSDVDGPFWKCTLNSYEDYTASPGKHHVTQQVSDIWLCGHGTPMWILDSRREEGVNYVIWEIQREIQWEVRKISWSACFSIVEDRCSVIPLSSIYSAKMHIGDGKTGYTWPFQFRCACRKH